MLLTDLFWFVIILYYFESSSGAGGLGIFLEDSLVFGRSYSS